MAGSVALNCTRTNGAVFGYFATGTDAANLTGTLNVARLPALGGDVSSSAGSNVITVGKINGVTAAAIATSGSASDLTSGTVALARLPAAFLTAPGVYATSSAGVATGLSVSSFVGGSGGTNGTYAVTITAPSPGTNAVVSVTVSGGAVTAASMTTAGKNFTTAQTITNAQIVSAGATGLSGASIALAPGGGVSFGAYFNVISAYANGVFDVYQSDASTGAAINTGKTTANETQLETASLGPSFTGTGTGVSVGNRSYFINTAIPFDSQITKLNLEVTGTGVVYLEVASFNSGTSAFTKITELAIPVNAASGVQTISTFAGGYVNAAAGTYIGIYDPQQLLTYDNTPSSPGYYYFTGAPAASPTVGTPYTSNKMRFSFEVQGAIKSSITANTVAITPLQTTVGGAGAFGVLPGSYSGTVGASTYCLRSPASFAGRLWMEIDGAAAGTGTLYQVTENAGTVTVVGSGVSVPIKAGANLIDTGITAAAGQYSCLIASGILQYSTPYTPKAGGWYFSGAPGVGTAYTNYGGWSLGMRFTVRSAMAQDVFALKNGATDPVGLLALTNAGADPTGAADSTSAFTAALASFPAPYVKPGTYKVTSLKRGFWGPPSANVLVNGVRAFLPSAPSNTSLQLAVRGRYLAQAYSGGGIAIVGDSITNGAYATAATSSWATLFTQGLNLGTSIDEPVLVNFDNSDASGGHTFHGLTLSGSPVNGTAGPVGKSLLLQPGQVLSFTGAYEQVDVTYQRIVSGGTLAFAYNGGAAYKTVSASGAVASDVFTGPSATGQTASGTYSITNTGGVAVEITCLIRYGVKTGGSPPRIPVFRFAHGSYAFNSFGSAELTSMWRIMSNVTGATNHAMIVALGTNDALGGTVWSTVNTNASTFLTNATAAGFLTRRIAGVMPWRWSTYSTPGTSYELGVSAVRDAYDAAGVKIINTDGVDFVGEYGGDGHPPPAGHAHVSTIIAEGLAR